MTLAAPTYLLALLAIPLVAAAYADRAQAPASASPCASPATAVFAARRRRPAAAAPRSCRPRCSRRPRRRSRSRSPSRRRPSRCRSRRRRSCSSPTSPARCRRPTSTRRGSRPRSRRRERSSTACPDKLLVGFVGFSSQTNAVVEPTLDRDEVQSALARPAGRRRHRDRRRARRGARPARGAPRQGRQARARRGDPALRRQAHRGQRPARGRAARQAARHPGLDRRARAPPSGTVTGADRASRSRSRPTRRRCRRSAASPAARSPRRPTPAQLDGVYKKLGSKVGTKHVKREVSSSFAAAGLVLLLAGLGTGLRWRGRLP